MIEVTKIKYLGGHRLHATFSDGTSGEHDFFALVAKTGPMGEPLRDPAYFARKESDAAAINGGTGSGSARSLSFGLQY